MDKHRTPRAHAEPAPRHGARTAALQAGGEAEHDALAASPRSVAQRQRIAAAFGPVLQRTAASAAQALVDEGNTDKMKLAAFIKWLRVKVGSGQAKQANSALHAVAADDFAAVMLAITAIRNAGAAQKKLDATQKVLDQALMEAQVTPSGGVSLTVGTVTGYLDADQLPHQAKGIAIGTRTANKKADSRFGSYADAAWHRANTLVTMTG